MKMRLAKTAAHVLKDAMTVAREETTDATTAAHVLKDVTTTVRHAQKIMTTTKTRAAAIKRRRNSLLSLIM